MPWSISPASLSLWKAQLAVVDGFLFVYRWYLKTLLRLFINGKSIVLLCTYLFIKCLTILLSFNNLKWNTKSSKDFRCENIDIILKDIFHKNVWLFQHERLLILFYLSHFILFHRLLLEFWLVMGQLQGNWYIILSWLDRDLVILCHIVVVWRVYCN